MCVSVCVHTGALEAPNQLASRPSEAALQRQKHGCLGMTEQLRVTRMQDSKAMQEPKALSWKNIAVSGYDMFCFVNGTALDLQTKDGETVLQTFQRTGKAA